MAKVADEPHGQSDITSNSAGPLPGLSRCGAKTRGGEPCRQVAMPNGRCYMHGGKSTGPKTPGGLARSRMANYKHGRYSTESLRQARAMSKLLAECRQVMQDLSQE